MSRRDPMVSVRQMLDHAREAAEMARGRTRADLDADRKLNLALVRLVEVTGEAATRLPDDFRSAHPEVPWRGTVGMRNRLIHGYDAIDFDRLWEVVQHDLPPLIRALEAIVNETGQPMTRGGQAGPAEPPELARLSAPLLSHASLHKRRRNTPDEVFILSALREFADADVEKAVQQVCATRKPPEARFRARYRDRDRYRNP